MNLWLHRDRIFIRVSGLIADRPIRNMQFSPILKKESTRESLLHANSTGNRPQFPVARCGSGAFGISQRNRRHWPVVFFHLCRYPMSSLYCPFGLMPSPSRMVGFVFVPSISVVSALDSVCFAPAAGVPFTITVPASVPWIPVSLGGTFFVNLGYCSTVIAALTWPQSCPGGVPIRIDSNQRIVPHVSIEIERLRIVKFGVRHRLNFGRPVWAEESAHRRGVVPCPEVVVA